MIEFYPCYFLVKSINFGNPENVRCGEPSTRFFDIYDGGETFPVPVCEKHVKFAYSPDRFKNDREVTEEEYVVSQLMRS
jgi:hypothetical protein